MSKHPSDRRVALDAAVALHHQQYAIQIHHGDLDSADADVLATASRIFGWLTRPAEHDPVLLALAARITSLEDAMRQTKEMIDQINTATNELAQRVERAMEGADAETAALLAPIVPALRGIAADPENPVPDPEPV